MSDAPNPVLAQPSVYQDLLFQRLRTLHGDHLDDRTSWVMTASGPLQRPTYASLFYRTWSAALPVVDVMLILKSRWRRDGERVWPDTGRCKGVCCCESAREITSPSQSGIANETPGRLECSPERRLTHRKARRRRRRSKHGSARLFVDVTLATDRGGPVGGRQIGLENTDGSAGRGDWGFHRAQPGFRETAAAIVRGNLTALQINPTPTRKVRHL
jgi:hypothetical protein